MVEGTRAWTALGHRREPARKVSTGPLIGEIGKPITAAPDPFFRFGGGLWPSTNWVLAWSPSFLDPQNPVPELRFFRFSHLRGPPECYVMWSQASAPPLLISPNSAQSAARASTWG